MEKLDKFSSFQFLIIFLKILTYITIILILSISFFTWAALDDYGYYNTIKEKGITGFVKWNYIENDSRYAPIFTLAILFSLFDFKNLHIVVFIYAISFILLSFLLNLFLNKFLKYKNDIFSFNLFICVLWLGLTPILNEVVYWATGGFYILFAFFSILWIIVIFNLATAKKTFRFNYLIYPLLIIFSFFMGGSWQNLVPALAVFAIIIIFIYWKDTHYKILLALSFFFLISGAIILFIAPGNYVKVNAFQGSINWNLIDKVEDFAAIFLDYNRTALNMIILSFCGSFLLVSYDINSLKKENYQFILKDKKTYVLLSFLFVSLLTILPFILAPIFATARASIFYIIFLFIFLFGFSFYFNSFIVWNIIRRFPKAKPILLFASIILLILINFCVITLSSVTIFKAIPIKKQLKERHEYLTNLSFEERNNDIVIEPIKGEKPTLLNLGTISTDKEHWINVGAAEIYNVKSVRLKEKPLISFPSIDKIKNYYLINSIFYNFLEREPDKSEFKYWLRKINNGEETFFDLSESIFISSEFQDKQISDEELIEILFATFLGRKPESGKYLEELKNNSINYGSLLFTISESEEFKSLYDSNELGLFD
jgi:hypothetical protein